MTPNKIKLQNFDPEVLEYFHNKNTKITYDFLASDVVNDIKNGIGATQAYNDTELRQRIINLETNKLDSTSAESIYMKKVDAYTKTEVDNLFINQNTLINSKLSTIEADSKYIQNKDNVITETMLSPDLINKVNARYENQRPNESSGSDIDISDFNLLKTQVNNNTTKITDLQNYVNNNALLITSKITTNNLDASIVNILNNSRQNTIKIEYDDLSQELKNIIDTSGGDDGGASGPAITKLQENMAVDLGEIIIGDGIDGGNGVVKIRHCMMLDLSILLIADHSLFNEASAEAIIEQTPYIGEIDTNILYHYDSIESKWVQDTEYQTTSLYIVGKFALEFKTNNIYFGVDEDEILKIVDIASYATKTELTAANNKITTLTTDLNQANGQINTLTTNLTQAQADLTQTQTELAQAQTDITDIQGKVAILITDVENLKSGTPK